MGSKANPLAPSESQALRVAYSRGGCTVSKLYADYWTGLVGDSLNVDASFLRSGIRVALPEVDQASKCCGQPSHRIYHQWCVVAMPRTSCRPTLSPFIHIFYKVQRRHVPSSTCYFSSRVVFGRGSHMRSDPRPSIYTEICSITPAYVKCVLLIRKSVARDQKCLSDSTYLYIWVHRVR
jgi:hypothetical protein